MSLASPRHASGRAIPPSVFPVVPAQRSRLGLRKPAGSPAPPVSAPLSPEPGPLDPGLFEPLVAAPLAVDPVAFRSIAAEPVDIGPISDGPVDLEPVDAEAGGAVEVIEVVAAEDAGGAVETGGQRSWWRRVRR